MITWVIDRRASPRAAGEVGRRGRHREHRAARRAAHLLAAAERHAGEDLPPRAAGLPQVHRGHQHRRDLTHWCCLAFTYTRICYILFTTCISLALHECTFRVCTYSYCNMQWTAFASWWTRVTASSSSSTRRSAWTRYRSSPSVRPTLCSAPAVRAEQLPGTYSHNSHTSIINITVNQFSNTLNHSSGTLAYTILSHVRSCCEGYATGCTRCANSRKRCSRRRCPRSRGRTWPTWCFSSRVSASKTCSPSISWTHHLRFLILPSI